MVYWELGQLFSMMRTIQWDPSGLESALAGPSEDVDGILYMCEHIRYVSMYLFGRLYTMEGGVLLALHPRKM